MVSVNTVNKQTLIEYEDFLFMYIEEESAFDNSKLYYVDAIIINSTDPALFEKVLRESRTHYDAEIYLKPIFCIKYNGLSKFLMDRCDGTTDVTQYQQVAQITKMIKDNIAKLYLQQKFPSSEFGVLYKTMQFLFTRNIDLTPIPNRHSRFNYLYPFINLQISDEDAFKVIEILKIAVQDGFLREEEMIDKIHLCDDCNSAHYNMRETCLHCQSIDLNIEDLIHHFQCAYIGPESDFLNEYTDDMVCPKCQKTLRHIGVDYDKPSHIYGCRSCNEHFQNPMFTFHCMDCGKTSEIRHLHDHLIKRLSLTSKGKHLMLSGLPKKVYDTDEEMEAAQGVYELEVFKRFLKQEQARTKFNPGKTFFGKVTLTDPEFNNVSWRERAVLQTELSAVLKSYLKEYDMVSSANLGAFYYLMLETTEARSEEIKEVIIYNLEHLVKSNIDGSKVKAEVEVMPVIFGEKLLF